MIKKTPQQPGFELGDIQVPLSGERIHAELNFNQCRVPAANIIGEPGKGLLLGLKKNKHKSRIPCRRLHRNGSTPTRFIY
ncbi:hypothetical protein RCO48_10230 [Peribacillus frigoritolerans]|nr:hypothetical protein [Peribacillus frigoritolerans]